MPRYVVGCNMDEQSWKTMKRSDSCEWETPQKLYDELNEEFHFLLDACATYENAKCVMYYDKAADGLKQPWIGTVWCNPPYGRGIADWVKKAYEESKNGVTSVLLTFARTDTKWFHEYVLGKAEIRFLRGRVKFGGAKNNAPFPSILIIYRGEQK